MPITPGHWGHCPGNYSSLSATLQIWLINEEPQSCLLSVDLVSYFSLPPLTLTYFNPSPHIGAEFPSFSLFFLIRPSYLRPPVWFPNRTFCWFPPFSQVAQPFQQGSHACLASLRAWTPFLALLEQVWVSPWWQCFLPCDVAPVPGVPVSCLSCLSSAITSGPKARIIFSVKPSRTLYPPHQKVSLIHCFLRV